MSRPIIPYDPKLKKLARKLRKNSTKSEIILWNRLKNKQMHGVDFHRQRPVDKYIVDFLCPELWLVIELDGLTHLMDERANSDLNREKRLKDLGLHVIRFWDEQIYRELNSVLDTIEQVVLLLKIRYKV